MQPRRGCLVEPLCHNRACSIDLFPVYSPRQHSLDAVDRLFVMVVTMGWNHQALCSRDNDLKCRNAATRVLSGDQEADRERPETDDLVRRIDMRIDGLQ